MGESSLRAWTLAVCLSLLAGGALLGRDQTVEMYQTVFFPAAFSIEVGDSVTWTWREGTHRLRSGLSPDDPDAGKLFDAVLDADNTIFTHLFRAPGIFAFFDEMNQTSGPGSISVIPFLVEVEVVDISFTPEEVSIFEGDALEWVWIEGDHTITSGNGSLDPRVGELFDEPSNTAQSYFSYAFTSVGVYDYFCRPHEEMRMFGKVRVQKRFLRGDFGADGTVDISDAIGILGFLFLGGEGGTCADSADANDDGSVDLSDAVGVLLHLFLGAASIPQPFPRTGADRTEDSLECW